VVIIGPPVPPVHTAKSPKNKTKKETLQQQIGY